MVFVELKIHGNFKGKHTHLKIWCNSDRNVKSQPDLVE